MNRMTTSLWRSRTLSAPGSIGATEDGCLCPVMDNRGGKGLGVDADGYTIFVINDDCPLHGKVVDNDN